jgi:Na+/H+-dicarboxylate symporter
MSNQINQFFGGPPVSVVVRLVLLSILVGVILSALGLDPLNLWRTLQNLVRQIWEMGFDALWWLWRYFLIGAVLVIPIWLVVRLAKGTRGRA